MTFTAEISTSSKTALGDRCAVTVVNDQDVRDGMESTDTPLPIDGDHTREDVTGAAEAVLTANGWKIVGDWEDGDNSYYATVERDGELTLGATVTVPEYAIPDDWPREGEIVEIGDETVVVELTNGYRQELPTDEVTVEGTVTSTTAALIIARAREAWTNDPDTEGGADAFDHHISIVGVQARGDFYQEVYAIANEGYEVVAGGGEAQLEERKERAATLWAEVLPELEAYAAECRNAEYEGWSPQSAGPIRRVR